MLETATPELAEAGSSTTTVQERAQNVLDALAHHVPHDAAWVAPEHPTRQPCVSQASTHDDRSTAAPLPGPTAAHDVDLTQTDRPRPPLSPSDLPHLAAELLAVALVDHHHHRHTGFVALLRSSRRPPEEAARRALHHLVPVPAAGVDPLRQLAAAARLLSGARAGAVLYPGEQLGDLPGLPADALLAPGSPLLPVTRSFLTVGRASSSFLWPCGGRHAPDGHSRVTVLVDEQQSSASALGAVVLSPATGDCRGLTARELEVVGLLVEGLSNAQIARRLVLAPGTVATHVEHVLHKLDAPSRTLAAVRADRQGLYVPAPLSARRDAGDGHPGVLR
ncbi:helix-turn-helix transcriptional regulator [Quadrisphaera setariae]|uniref:Response regulator transcription factor n=1 Tax=Quadrisphaera setariae TaxID=2593304 RepID=A0A5C8ZK62_9ACTN|nr:LuxR C-terminal-related transcriptional regulator [Quadrisphaera setariae]TXR57568.1 response regulator transcription factor [Quadrisphaera setariae]